MSASRFGRNNVGGGLGGGLGRGMGRGLGRGGGGGLGGRSRMRSGGLGSFNLTSYRHRRLELDDDESNASSAISSCSGGGEYNSSYAISELPTGMNFPSILTGTIINMPIIRREDNGAADKEEEEVRRRK